MFEGMSGAELAAALARVDVRALDAVAALDYAVAASRLSAWATAGEAAGLARTHALYPEPDPGPEGVDHRLDRHRAAVAEVRAAYGCSRLAASARIGFADALADLPRLASALAEGRLPIDHVRVLVRETEPLLGDPGLRRDVVGTVLDADDADRRDGGSGLTVRQVTLRVRRAVVAADPDRARREAARTRADRRAWRESRPDASEGVFGLTGPVDTAAECWAAVDALARQWRREGRPGTLDQLRFDAAHYLLTTRPEADRAPAGSWLGQITVPLSSVLGFDDAPGEILGVGAVPAPLARRLLAQSPVWQRLLTDPVDGHVVLQRIRSYRPTAEMRRFVLARSGGVCSARGCGATAGLQTDHVDRYPEGPTTSLNLGPDCPPDHNGKTHGHWIHEMDPDSGALRQTSPLGRQYTTRPTPPVRPTGLHADDEGVDGGGPAGQDPRDRLDGQDRLDRGQRLGAGADDADDDEPRLDRLSGDAVPPLPDLAPADDPYAAEAAPPDPAADQDRWPHVEEALLAARRRECRERATRLTAARAAAAHRREEAAAAEQAHRAEMAAWNARLEAITDHDLVAALNAEALAELEAGLDWGLDPALTAALAAGPVGATAP